MTTSTKPLGEWHRIDDPDHPAPMDGTANLFYAPGNKRAVAPRDTLPVIKIDHYSDEFRAFAHMRPKNPYTHWHPLPEPPRP